MSDTKSSKRMNLKVWFELTGEGGSRPRTLNSGGEMLAPFCAIFTNDDWTLTLTIDVVDGEPACTKSTVERSDGGDLKYYTTEISRGLNLRKLMSHAVAKAALEGEGGLMKPATSAEAIEAVLGPVRRTRVPADDDRLREVADAYRDRYKPGGATEFAESLHVSERQMYRLVKQARERNFLDDA